MDFTSVLKVLGLLVSIVQIFKESESRNASKEDEPLSQQEELQPNCVKNQVN